VVELQYEAYEPMALKKLAQLCSVVRSKWSQVHHVAIHHRTGVVGPAEASVVIAITSPHRQTSLEAVSFAIDELKATVPIWKKERYDDGSTWKENKECAWASTAHATSTHSALPAIDPSLVQIQASNEEMDRRIEAFMCRKREEIDASNILEFTGRHAATDSADDFGCARTDSILVRKTGQQSTGPGQSGSDKANTHLRKSEVDNTGWGPDHEKDPLTHGDDVITNPEGVEERVKNLEDHLAVVQAPGAPAPVKPVPKGFYARLKDVEDRVMFLEGLSPEYFPLFNTPQANLATQQTPGASQGSFTSDSQAEESNEQRVYKEKLSQSLSSINIRIQQLQNKLNK